MDPSIDDLVGYLEYEGDIDVFMEDDTDPAMYLNGTVCQTVLCYAIQFLSNSEEPDTLRETIRRLNDLAYEISMYWLCREPAFENRESLRQIFVYEFMPQVRKFFTVPNLVSLQQNENLAAFMNFLLQILNSAANRNQKRYGEKEDEDEKERRYSLLQKELKFLLFFLGDIPFQYTQLKDLKILLDEFEVIANEVGSFTYNCILATHQIMSDVFYAGRDAILEKVDLLNVKIKQFCNRFSELPTCVTRRMSGPIDSLFIVDSLLGDIKNLINRRFYMTIDDMEDQIEILYEELEYSRTFLKNTEVSGETKNDALKECFITIRDIAYEAEYLINSHVVGNIPTWYLKLRLPSLIKNLKLNGSRIQKIKTHCEVMQVTTDFTEKVSLQPMVDDATTLVEGLPKSFEKKNKEILGLPMSFEKKKEEILGDLTRGSKALKIITLIGMPGLGKTTLTKNLFDGSFVHDFFYKRAWCVISQVYEKRKVLVDILKCLCKQDEENLSNVDDESLGLKIHKILSGNRYLLVMDDVWDLKTWYDIKKYFPDGYCGSRIMLTSRNKDAVPNDSIFHTLQLLSEGECLDLLVKKVFLEEACPQSFLDFGKGIARKCHGLPLAVVAVAGILASSDKKESVWKKVERNLDSFILDDLDHMKVLEFSYEHLPDRLKLCYLYLGTFPEDAEILVRKIKWLWIAEGFIQREEGRSPEDVANDYLSNLVNRSLVLIAKRKSNGGIKTCGIHDLLRDMCLRKANEENFLKYTTDHFSIYEKHHRLRVYCKSPEVSRHYGLHCRSFSGHLPAPSLCFPQMPLLRVMDLLPIGNYREEQIDLLVHLRYLSLNTYQIPANLVNLEFLSIEVGGFFRTPSIILKMVKLRHLKIKHKAIFENDFDSDRKSNLKSLSYICIESLMDEDILKCFPHLHKLKCICHQSLFPDISFMDELESLNMNFDGHFNGELRKVNFPSTIKELSLNGIGLPWDAMSKLGSLPNLKVLKLFYEAFVGKEWKTVDGQFQKLTFLKLYQMNGLEQWITCKEHFPELQRLKLQNCGELKGIPSDLGDIPTLHTIEVNYCSSEANMSARQIQDEQRDYGNEELKFIIN